MFEWTAAEGYFSVISVIGCVDAYSLPKDSFWLWREQFVMSHDLHTIGKYYRTALRPSEACKPFGQERTDSKIPDADIIDQQGNLDDFMVTINCKEERGCSVLLRVTYHPLFVCKSFKTGAIIPTFALSPSYIGFVAPFGEDTYNVKYTPPLWSKLLFLVCYSSMFLFLFGSMFTLPSFLPGGRKKKHVKNE